MDSKDINVIKNPLLRDIVKKLNPFGVMITKEYFEQECLNLAEQLKTVAKG